MKKFFYAVAVLVPLLALFSCATTRNSSPVRTKSPSLTKVIPVTGGNVQGVLNADGSVEIFAGIPFAAPPVGALRWKEPQDVVAWEGVYAANRFAPMAMQKRDSALYNFLFNAYTHQKTSRTYNAPMSEDCLYLNIWRPSEHPDAEKLPVLVYIHGGSLMGGQSWYEKYDGENLARHGIIVVTVAYRTGVFGYFADTELAAESVHGTTGNYGLLDQIKALQWVQENITEFGGDAGNVTIAGESAGSSSVNALCASPLTKDLFRRAIAESSSVIQKTPPHTFRTMESALKMGEDIKKEFNVTTAEELRKIPAKKLIKTKFANNAMTVDGYALTETPYETYKKGLNHEEALLNGFNRREAFGFTFFTSVKKKNLAQLLRPSLGDSTEPFIAAYAPQTDKAAKSLYDDVFSAVCFSYPHEVWTKTVTAQGRPVYEYYFSKENGEIGTNHSGELIYAYRNVPRNAHYNDADFALEEAVSSYWLNFIKTGNPNGTDTAGTPLPLWLTSAQSNGQVLEFGETVRMCEDPFRFIYGYLENKE